MPESKQEQLFYRSFGPGNKEAEGGSCGRFPERKMQVYTSTQGERLPELSVSLLGKFYLNTGETGFDVWKKVSFNNNREELEALIMARHQRSKCDRDSSQTL